MTLPSRVPARLREPVLCALACAEERVHAAQIAATRDLLLAVDGVIPTERSLAIALRLLGVSPAERRLVAVGVLAQLGAQGMQVGAGPFAGSEGLLDRLRRRLGGRKAPELRRRLTAETVGARAQLHAAYLAGVAEVVAIVGEALPCAEVVQLYLDQLAIGPGWAECVFHDAIGEIAA